MAEGMQIQMTGLQEGIEVFLTAVVLLEDTVFLEACYYMLLRNSIRCARLMKGGLFL
jgi:hypothetical protein